MDSYESKLTFKIYEQKLVFPEEYHIVNYYYWDFNNMTKLMWGLFDENYIQKNPTIEQIIKATYITCKDIIYTSAKYIIEELCKYEIYGYDADLFIESYFDYFDTYGQIMAPVVDKYCSIMNLGNNLEKYRNEIKNTRMHVQGGGFGIGGAVKGMLSAYIMNCGIDFVNSFSDAKRERTDNSIVAGELGKLKKEIIEEKYYNKAIESVIEGIRRAFFNMLYEYDVLSEEYEFDKKTARIMINNIIASNNTLEYKKKKIVGCLINVYPYFPDIYAKLLEKETDLENKREIVRLAEFYKCSEQCTLINNEGKMVNQSGREEIGLRRKKNRY